MPVPRPQGGQLSNPGLSEKTGGGAVSEAGTQALEPGPRQRGGSPGAASLPRFLPPIPLPSPAAATPLRL